MCFASRNAIQRAPRAPNGDPQAPKSRSQRGNSRAQPPERPRLARTQQFSQHPSQIVRRGLQQVALPDVLDLSQPTPPRSARLARVRKRPLDYLATAPLQPLAVVALRAISVQAVRSLLLLLVC